MFGRRPAYSKYAPEDENGDSAEMPLSPRVYWDS